jgi:ADP-heptose:LPS heptosyltransferase
MQEKQVNILNIFYRYCSRYSRIIIYGAGDVGAMVADFMEEKDILFECFCVTENPETKILKGHKIREIDEVVCSDSDIGIVVAASQRNVKGMLSLLKKYGQQYFYNTEFLFQLYVRRCQEKASKVMTQDGYLYRISDVVFERDKMYICCPASIGDTLYTAAFVRDYKKENPSVRKVCLILKKGHRDLGHFFRSVDEVLVSDEIVEILDSYSLYTQTWKQKNYIYGHFKKSIRFEYDIEYAQAVCRMILPRYRSLIMGLSEEAKMEEAACEKSVGRIEKQNSKVVIMPYAKTAELLPISFWEELVRRLVQDGYSVFTNIAGEKEKPVVGTEPMQESLLDTALFCEECTAVVSLRSGLCDLLGFTSAKLIVVNTSEELYSEWNLQDVFHKEGIYNINYFGNQNDKTKLEEILKIVKNM